MVYSKINCDRWVLDLYKFYINLQKHTSNLGYKYWIPRSLYMTKNHLSPVCGTLESSETRRAYQSLSLLGYSLIRTTEISLFNSGSQPSVQQNIGILVGGWKLKLDLLQLKRQET